MGTTTQSKASPTDVVKAIVNENSMLKAIVLDSGVRLENASLKEIAPPIITDPLATNTFLKNLYNKFILTEVIDGRFENPLAPMKKERVAPFGDTVERTIFNPAKAIQYDSSNENILTAVPPDVKVEYIRVNRKDKYPVSIPRPALQQAFTNDGSFASFMTGAMSSLYNGDSIDEFQLMKKVVSDIFDATYLPYKELKTGVVDQTVDIITAMKMFKFPSDEYNVYSKKYPDNKLTTWSDPKNIFLIVDVETLTKIRVEELAAAFNLKEVEIGNNIIEVDGFEKEGLRAIVCDWQYFQVRDTLYEIADFFRADDLSTKTYLHHWQTMTSSLLCNAIAFVDPGTTPKES